MGPRRSSNRAISAPFFAGVRTARWYKLTLMEVRLSPETESQLRELAARTGRSPADLIEDATALYLKELARTRDMLDSRYDDIKSGRVKSIKGQAFFEGLRRREEELLSRRSTK